MITRIRGRIMSASRTVGRTIKKLVPPYPELKNIEEQGEKSTALNQSATTLADADIQQKLDLDEGRQAKAIDYLLPDHPLADWPEPWNTGHHLETGADGVVRAVADTPEIAARDERYHQAAAEFFEETSVYVAPDGWDTEVPHHEEPETEKDFEAEW